ncbi:AAA family ATPase [Candidatus Woesearchaeota archaeon]|nr:AAA family ATPase [Candidatus Woesearchaeota archaeon]
MTVVLITGSSCTGKTTLGKWLSEHLNIPLISKDSYKELVFDHLGWSDREWSKKVGALGFDLLYGEAEKLIMCGYSFIAEGNFRPDKHSHHWTALQKTYHVSIVQVLCHAHGDVLVERFRQRVTNGERHPGHVDHITIEELTRELHQGKYCPLSVEGRVIEVNTTKFSDVKYDQILQQIKEEIEKRNDGRITPQQ